MLIRDDTKGPREGCKGPISTNPRAQTLGGSAGEGVASLIGSVEAWNVLKEPSPFTIVEFKRECQTVGTRTYGMCDKHRQCQMPTVGSYLTVRLKPHTCKR